MTTSAASRSTSPDEATSVQMLRAAIGQVEFARQYTLELLAATPQTRWFETPEGAPTHIAWQVGHLAVSQYGLLLFRLHGRREGDSDLMPGRFRKAFGRSSDPTAAAAQAHTADELLSRLAKIHETAVAGLADLHGATLMEAVEMPYAVYPTKLGAILFCPLHESLHAGQIGLIRRQLGLPPIR